MERFLATGPTPLPHRGRSDTIRGCSTTQGGVTIGMGRWDYRSSWGLDRSFLLPILSDFHLEMAGGLRHFDLPGGFK